MFSVNCLHLHRECHSNPRIYTHSHIHKVKARTPSKQKRHRHKEQMWAALDFSGTQLHTTILTIYVCRGSSFYNVNILIFTPLQISKIFYKQREFLQIQRHFYKHCELTMSWEMNRKLPTNTDKPLQIQRYRDATKPEQFLQILQQSNICTDTSIIANKVYYTQRTFSNTEALLQLQRYFNKSRDVSKTYRNI